MAAGCCFGFIQWRLTLGPEAENAIDTHPAALWRRQRAIAMEVGGGLSGEAETISLERKAREEGTLGRQFSRRSHAPYRNP